MCFRIDKDLDDNLLTTKDDETSTLNNIREEERKHSIHNKNDLVRLKKLLEKQRMIKEEYLKTLGVSTHNPKLNHMKLEEGTPPSKINKTKEKEIKAERLTAQTPFIERPFIGTYDISDDSRKEQKLRKRRKDKAQELNHSANQPDDSQTSEDQSRSENTLVPVYVSTGRPSVHNHDHTHPVYAVDDRKLPTVFYNDFHSDPHYLEALRNFRNEYALKSQLSQPNINRDIRLEIPITLDAKISIPEYQKEFGNLFKNFTPRFVLGDDLAQLTTLGEYHRQKAKDESHKYSMLIANHAQPKPQNQKKNYKAGPKPQTNENAYLLPEENFQTLYGMANLEDSESSSKLPSSYGVPTHMLHMQPPSQLYQLPKTKHSHKEISTLYDPPHKELKKLYEAPKKSLSLFEALQSMSPPNQLYKIPDVSHTGYGALIGPSTNNPLNLIDASSSLYNAPLQKDEHGYKPPSGYDYSPPNGYKASNNPTFPKALYEEPKKGIKVQEGYDYTPPNGYDASKNPTFPKQLYEAPNKHIKEDPEGYTYKPPKGYKASENPTFPKSLYEAPKGKEEGKKASYKAHPEDYEPPEGYDYKVPVGYKPSDNPTFPTKSYEAPALKEHQKEGTAHLVPKGYNPPKGYDYKTPKGYNADDNPTFPKQLYETPDISSKYETPKSKEVSFNYKAPPTHDSLPVGYKPPEGYDYKVPQGYTADDNPTFPKQLYNVPEISTDHKETTAYKTPVKGYDPPEGYDYKTPSGYKADTNPTFPKKLYKAPHEVTEYKPPPPSYDSPQKGYSPPQGYDYKTPKGYDAAKNPTFPHNTYVAPNEEPLAENYGPPNIKYKEPPKGYSPPSGNDYETPKGYNPGENPTFPNKIPTKLPAGYKAPDGYDYKSPKGYEASENPTFPQKLYEAPKTAEKKKKESLADYKAALDTGYTPPGQEHKELHLPRKSNKHKKKPGHGYSPPAGYDYNAPDGYNAAENPTFPQKSHTETPDSYKPPKKEYKAPSKEKPVGYIPPSGYDYPVPENYDPAHNPTFPKHHKKAEGEAGHIGYTYEIPSENYDPSLNPTYPKHRFNIIIKNKDKPDTELVIRPESGYAPPELVYKPPENNYKSDQKPEITPVNKLYQTSHAIEKESGPNYNPDYNHNLHNGQLNAKLQDINSKQAEFNVEEKYGVPTGLAKLALNAYEKKQVRIVCTYKIVSHNHSLRCSN